MSDDEINRKIAEACGQSDKWILIKNGYFYRPNSAGYTSDAEQAGIYTEAEAKSHASGCSGEVTACLAPVKDYIASLDACSEFEKTFTEDQCEAYQDALAATWIEDSASPIPAEEYFWHASARHRCEAFIRMIGEE